MGMKETDEWLLEVMMKKEGRKEGRKERKYMVVDDKGGGRGK